MNRSQTCAELLEELNALDEVADIEAKSLKHDTSRSILETVCSFSNEPGLGGGTILIGIAEHHDIETDEKFYADGVEDLDHAQTDLATQCKTAFSIPVYPRISVERIGGKNVLRVFVQELPPSSKPLYFKNDGLPNGAYRRVGSADLFCTDEDVNALYQGQVQGFDATPMPATIDEVDPLAIKAYREFRKKVNPAAEELLYDDAELLKALNCVIYEDPKRLNVAGVLLFGSQKLLRRVMPMVRVDYIRIHGDDWVKDVDDSFESADCRGALMLLVGRLINIVQDDLPRTFSLSDNDPQAEYKGLPYKALREAIVNALMHASYRVARPIQIIRYSNRIEIINPGYSLKSPDRLGELGSVTRNTIIAPVFHDTNLAETKGSGMARMRKFMEEAHMATPTYESDRVGNTFTLRLLLHHFLGEEDLAWLKRFDSYELTDAQKTALVFLREVKAIDNPTYRQMSGLDTLKASIELRKLRDVGLVRQKGSSVATYYVPSWKENSLEDKEPSLIGKGVTMLDKSPSMLDKDHSMLDKAATMLDNGSSMLDKAGILKLYPACSDVLSRLGKRMKYEAFSALLCDLCAIAEFTRHELVALTGRNEDYIRTIIAKMLREKRLVLKYPQMLKHPNQAYRANPDYKGLDHD